MKKTISVLLVVLLATACLFADVSLTGELGFGYKVKFNGDVENSDYLNLGSTYGGRFKIKLGSDYVNGELRMDAIKTDGSDPAFDMEKGTITTGVRQPINAYATIKASKLVDDVFNLSLPVGIELYVGNQSFSTSYSWAYLDPQGNEDKISLNAARASMPFGGAVSFENLVTVKSWGSITTGDQKGLLEAQVSPVDGVKAMIAYGINQDGKDNFQTAALVDVKTLANLDFNLAVSGQIIANTDKFEDASYYASLTYSHGQAHGNLAMVTTAAPQRASYTVSGPRDPSGLAL